MNTMVGMQASLHTSVGDDVSDHHLIKTSNGIHRGQQQHMYDMNHPYHNMQQQSQSQLMNDNLYNQQQLQLQQQQQAMYGNNDAGVRTVVDSEPLSLDGEDSMAGGGDVFNDDFNADELLQSPLFNDSAGKLNVNLASNNNNNNVACDVNPYSGAMPGPEEQAYSDYGGAGMVVDRKCAPVVQQHMQQQHHHHNVTPENSAGDFSNNGGGGNMIMSMNNNMQDQQQQQMRRSSGGNSYTSPRRSDYPMDFHRNNGSNSLKMMQSALRGSSGNSPLKGPALMMNMNSSSMPYTNSSSSSLYGNNTMNDVNGVGGMMHSNSPRKQQAMYGANNNNCSNTNNIINNNNSDYCGGNVTGDFTGPVTTNLEYTGANFTQHRKPHHIVMDESNGSTSCYRSRRPDDVLAGSNPIPPRHIVFERSNSYSSHSSSTAYSQQQQQQVDPILCVGSTGGGRPVVDRSQSCYLTMEQQGNASFSSLPRSVPARSNSYTPSHLQTGSSSSSSLCSPRAQQQQQQAQLSPPGSGCTNMLEQLEHMQRMGNAVPTCYVNGDMMQQQSASMHGAGGPSGRSGSPSLQYLPQSGSGSNNISPYHNNNNNVSIANPADHHRKKQQISPGAAIMMNSSYSSLGHNSDYIDYGDPMMNGSGMVGENGGVTGGKGQPPATLNEAMEKLCESMKRSAMSRNLVKQFSQGRGIGRAMSARDLMVRQNSASQHVLGSKQLSSRNLIVRQGSNRSLKMGVVDGGGGGADNMNMSNSNSGGRGTPTTPAVPLKRQSNPKHRLVPGRGVHRHDSQQSLGAAHSSHGPNGGNLIGITLQIDGHNVGTF